MGLHARLLELAFYCQRYAPNFRVFQFVIPFPSSEFARASHTPLSSGNESDLSTVCDPNDAQGATSIRASHNRLTFRLPTTRRLRSLDG